MQNALTPLHTAQEYAHSVLSGVPEDQQAILAAYLNVALAEADEPVSIAERLWLAREACGESNGLETRRAIRRGSKIVLAACALGMRKTHS